MSKLKPNPYAKPSPTDQLVIVLSNSKYTYAQFTDFHQTVLNILDNNDLSHLTKSQKKSTLFFIDIILRLLDAPKAPTTSPKTKPISTNPYSSKAKSQETPLSAPSKETQPSTSKEHLSELLTWITHLVKLKHITIENMLDQFFNLNLIKQRPKIIN